MCGTVSLVGQNVQSVVEGDGLIVEERLRNMPGMEAGDAEGKTRKREGVR